MTARRGSLRFRVIRLARNPLVDAERSASLKRSAKRALLMAGRCISGLAAVLVVTTMGSQVWRVGAENYRLHRQIAEIERQNNALESESQDLVREIRLLHYPEYLVPLIHEQLGLSKAHEVLVRVQVRTAQ